MASNVSDGVSVSPRVKRARTDAQDEADDATGSVAGTDPAEGSGAYMSVPPLQSSSRAAELSPAVDSAGERPTERLRGEAVVGVEPSSGHVGGDDNRLRSDDDQSPGHLGSRGSVDSSADGAAPNADEPHFSAVLAAAPGRLLDALPPQSAADAPPAVLARFRQYLALSAAGHSFTGVLKRKREFGNPCVLDKVIAHFGIAQHGELALALCSQLGLPI